MTYRFLHAADLHLDAPFRGLAQRDPQLAASLRDASLTALDRLVSYAIEADCHFVVFAGDIYDGLERGIRAQLRLREAAGRLHDAGIPLVMLHGNHDPLDLGYTAVRDWPSSTALLAAAQPQVVELDSSGGRATLTGQSFPAKKVTHSLAAGYPSPEGPGLHVAVLHTELVRGADTNSYSPCTLDELVDTTFHYWALGHIHDPKVLHDAMPVVAYPGNLQGRHFQECGPRGALLVEGSPDRLKVTPVPLAPYVFERVALDVTEHADLASVQQDLLDAVPERRGTVLLRAELTGSSELYEALHDEQRCSALLAQLNDGSPEDAVWMEVRSDVLPDVPWESLEDQPSLSGALYRRERTGSDVREALRGNTVLRPLSSSLTDDELSRLAERAVRRAIHAIHPREKA